MTKSLRIGELSRQVGASTHTIRYYEQLGLMNEPRRTKSRYRLYTKADVARLQFIHKAKLFNLSLDEIRLLISLGEDGISPCKYLRDMVKEHIDELNKRITEMTTFRDELATRYEQLQALGDSEAGDICGIIEKQVLPPSNSN